MPFPFVCRSAGASQSVKGVLQKSFGTRERLIPPSTSYSSPPPSPTEPPYPSTPLHGAVQKSVGTLENGPPRLRTATRLPPHLPHPSTPIVGGRGLILVSRSLATAFPAPAAALLPPPPPPSLQPEAEAFSRFGPPAAANALAHLPYLPLMASPNPCDLPTRGVHTHTLPAHSSAPH